MYTYVAMATSLICIEVLQAHEESVVKLVQVSSRHRKK